MSFLQEHPDLLLGYSWVDLPCWLLSGTSADFSLEPTLTSPSGTSADFSPWNQRSLFANLVHKRCNCRSSFVFRRFSVLESASPCGWTAISRILKPQIDSIDQDNFFSHKSSVFIIKLYELLSCRLTINYWQKIWCYVFLYVFACGARVHQPVEGIDFSLKACLEGPIPQLPLMTWM